MTVEMSEKLRPPAVASPSEPSERPSSDDRLRELVDAYFEFIWRSLRRLGVPLSDTDDATQEVFMVASRRLGDITPGSERSFLFGTALRVASTQRRSAERRREQPDGTLEDWVDSKPGPDALTEQRRARRMLDEILDGLELDVRTVFVLFELEELTAPEISELLGIPLGTVASRLRRARDDFRSELVRRRARSLSPRSKST